MESRNAPRDHATVSHPPSSRQLENVSDSESSDSNDDDIPAITTNRLSVSPSKSLSVTSASKPVSATAPANLHANPLKKSLTEAARGGIVLYPGSKRQRTGYNMRPNSVESSSHLSPVALRPPPKTDPSPPNSPGTNTEDDVRQGLVSNMNNAFRHLKPAQSQDPVEQWPRNEEGSASPYLGEADPAESGEGKSTDNRHPGLSPVNRQRSPSEIGSMISPTENGLCEEPSEASHAAHHEAKATEDKNETGDAVSSPMGEVPVLGRENPAGVEMQAQVGATSRNTSEYDVEVPQSPVGPDRQDVPQSTSNNQKSQHTKKRSRSPKISKTRFPNKSMRSEGVTSPRELLSRATETDSIQQGQAEDSEQVNQNSDAHPSASVPGVIQTQAPKTTTPSNRIFPTSNRSQTAKPNFQAKSGRAKDAAPTVNLTVPNDRAGNLNGLSRTSNHDNDSGNHEYINEYSSTNLRATVDDEPSSDFLDGFSVDFGDDDATYSPAEDSDVPEDSSDDDITAIHMDHQPLWQLCELLGDTAWGGMKGGWQWQDFDYSGAATEPARALLPLLTKLERLCKDAPRAPNLKEQSKFLRRHNDLLDYYADKIATVVEHIRTQRIEIPENNATARNTDPGKRKRMTRDLVLYVMPMLVHVLASAWGLGGKTWFKTLFTSTVVFNLLRQILDWIMILHRGLSLELARCPLEEEPEGERQRKVWERHNARRKEIAPLLGNLDRVITVALGEIHDAERRAKEERQHHEELEEQLDIEPQAARNAVAVSTAAKRKGRTRELMKGVDNNNRSKSPTTSSSFPRRSSASASASASSAAAKPKPKPKPKPKSKSKSVSKSTGTVKWTMEEQEVLFRYIQKAYPACPDLNRIRWELNKSYAETATMAEHILGKMLAVVLKDWSAEERAAKVREIIGMRTSSSR